MSYKLLIINPGSTSTKIGIYEDEKQLFVETLRHSSDEIGKYAHVVDQLSFRKEVILNFLKEKNFDLGQLDAVVGRGGLLKPIEGGTYAVNDAMLHDLKIGYQGEHASNLGGILANEIAKPLNIPAYIVDPVVVDELTPVAKISGMPETPRRSIFHALNQKAVAKRYAKEHGKKYDEVNVIVAHMGGGISVGAHDHGRIVDVNNALDGEGSFSPERAGAVSVRSIVEMCYSGKYTEEEMKKKISGKGGFVAFLNTNDARNVEAMAEGGDKNAELIYEAMAYQVSKEIGKCATVLKGKVDAIILTGGIAYSKKMTALIKERVSFIADFVVYPGEDELLALAQGGIGALSGAEKVKEYK